MSIDSMIDEPLHLLVGRCIRRRDHLQKCIELRVPDFMVLRARRSKANAYAALRARMGYAASQDPLEEMAFDHIIKEAMKGKRI